MSDNERDDEIESMFSDDVDTIETPVKSVTKSSLNSVKKPVKKSSSSSLKKSVNTSTVSDDKNAVKKTVNKSTTGLEGSTTKKIVSSNKSTKKSATGSESTNIKKSVKSDISTGSVEGTIKQKLVTKSSVNTDVEDTVKKSVKSLGTDSEKVLGNVVKKPVKKSSSLTESLEKKSVKQDEAEVEKFRVKDSTSIKKKKSIEKSSDIAPVIKDEPVDVLKVETKSKSEKVETEEEDMFTVLEKIGDDKVTKTEDDKSAILYFVITIVIIIIISMIAISMNKVEDKEVDNKESSTSVSVSEVPVKESESIETVVTSQVVSYGDIDTFSNTNYTFLQVNRDVWATYDNYNPVKAYISVSGTDINYNVFQADDNEKFLEADGFGEYSDHGSIFADYRNNLETLDENNVIYGHNMADGTMFAGLLKLRDSSHYVNDSDFLIYLDSRGYNNVFKIFSVYEVDLTTFNFIQTGFEGNEKQEFLDTIKSMNQVDVLNSDEVSVDSKLITLSTCTQQGTHRVVVHGYLVAREVAK